MSETAPAQAITCPQCGWSYDGEALRKNACKKCRSVLIVTCLDSLQSIEKPAIQKYIGRYSQTLKSDPKDRDALLGIGLCYLKQGLTALAGNFFARLIDACPEDPAGYFYRAIGLFNGRRPRLSSLGAVREAERLLETAAGLDPSSGRYEALLGAIRRDYYVLNGMRVPTPGPEELERAAAGKHLAPGEMVQALGLLEIEKAVCQHDQPLSARSSRIARRSVGR